MNNIFINILCKTEINKRNIIIFNDNIRNSVEYIFDMFFKEHCMMENSMIEGMKEVRVRNILSNEIFDKYLKIPTNYFKINKLYLELITAETDYSISGFTRKFVFNDYDEINISSMRNGVYGLYIYKYNNLFNKPLKFKIKIKNSKENFNKDNGD